MRTFSIFIFVSICLFADAQPCKVSFGTKTLYTPQQIAYTKPPEGYEPIFINHVGRHGARHLTKDLSATVAYKLLLKADSLHALTSEGEKLMGMVSMLRIIEAPELKSISQRGRNELESIAARMVKRNRMVFEQSPLQIDVEITKEVRTSQSADAFLKGLNDEAYTSTIKKRVNDTALRFYDLSPAYLAFEENGNWKQTMSDIQSTKTLVAANLQQFPEKFFKKDFQVSAKDKDEFCKDVYGFSAIVPSINYEIEKSGKRLIDLDFRSLFSCDQLAALGELDEAEDFLLKGPGKDTLGIQVTIAVPLLVAFINTTDNALQEGTASVRLRFAHAETIAPFAALMQIATASRAVPKPENFSATWKADQVIPLSANIQWIFYKKKNVPGYLVKFLLNEKEVTLKGLGTTIFPFYRWKDVRKYYTNLLSKLQVSLTDHMDTYLLSLKP